MEENPKVELKAYCSHDKEKQDATHNVGTQV